MSQPIPLKPAFLVALAVVATLLLALVVAPFAGALFTAAVFATVAFPLQRALSARLGGRRGLAAGLITTAGVVVILLPLVVVGTLASEQVASLYRAVQATLQQEGVAGLIARLPEAVRATAQSAVDWLGRLSSPDEGGGAQLDGAVIGRALGIAGDVIEYAGGAVFDLGMTVIAFFFLLAQGQDLVAWTVRVAPIERRWSHGLLMEFRSVTRGVFYATVATAMIQGTLGAIGYLIAGTPYLATVITLTFVAALVPMIGGAAVVALVGVWSVLNGDTGFGVFLVVWGLVVVGLSDNIVKPWLARDSVKLPGSVVLFAMIGGLAVFGPMGVVAGPLVVAFFLAALQLLTERADGSGAAA